ncbi:MAG: hypothetical protein E6J69_05495 [Deltaproteobacteria bacterium]|nr:MAG: hypothetical protein E6J69_05495 [Deltaproteobacteria bacterium]
MSGARGAARRDRAGRRPAPGRRGVAARAAGNRPVRPRLRGPARGRSISAPPVRLSGREGALAAGPPGPYALQAAIAAVHARAARAEDTDWRAIGVLYEPQWPLTRRRLLGFAAQGEAAVEGRRRHAVDDVGADPQPVRIQVRVADPHLQVAGELRARARRGQPEEVATLTLQLHLGHEEEVVGREVERRVEIHVEADLLPRHRPLAPRELIRRRMDAIDHGVGSQEMGIENRGCELQVSVCGAAVGKRDVRRRVRPGGHVHRACGVRVVREHAIDLHAHFAYLAVTPVEQQPREGGVVEQRRRREDEVIGRLDLDLAAAFGAGCRGHQAIRFARAEGEIIRGGWGSQHERERQDGPEAR